MKLSLLGCVSAQSDVELCLCDMVGNRKRWRLFVVSVVVCS